MTGSEVTTFLGIVERDRVARCDAILRDARDRAAELLREARREARRRVSTAVADDRARSRRRIEAARAELLTRERQLDREVAAKLLARGWDALRQALLAQWQEPEGRARWIAELVADARRLLPHGTWRIRHPPALAEIELVARVAGEASGAAPELEPDPDIAAGLCVHVAGATLDGTLEGLLADRGKVEGRLLMELAGGGGAS